MKLEFHTMSIKAFKAIEDLEIDFDWFEPGAHSIKGVNAFVPRLGSNGVGKSSINDALSFALYGKTPRGLRAPALIPWDNPKANPIVTLTFKTDDDLHTVRREGNPHRLSVDGKTVEQAFLDALILVPFPLFIHTVCFAQGEPLFLDLKPAEKLTLISEVLSLSRFDDYSAAASKKTVNLKEKINILTNDLSKVEGRLHEATAQMLIFQKKKKTFEQDKKERVATTKKDYDTISEKYLAAQRALAQIPDVAPLKDAYTKCEREQIEKAKVEREASLAHAKLSHLRTKLQTMSKLGGICVTCEQPIDAEHQARQKKTIVAQLAKLPDLASIRAELHAAVAKTEAAHKAYRAANDLYYSLSSAVTTAEVAVDRALTTHQIAVESISPYDTDIKIINIRADKLAAELRKISTEIEVAENLSARYTSWAAAFKDIKLMLVDNTMYTLSMLTSAYSSQLGLECSVVFSVERESKSGTQVKGINMTVDGISRFESWSLGEGQRVRLASSLALATILLSEAGVDLPLRILDEPSAHLSVEGLRELTGFLVEHGKQEGLVVFITDQRPISGATSTLTVTRSATGVSIH